MGSVVTSVTLRSATVAVFLGLSFLGTQAVARTAPIVITPDTNRTPAHLFKFVGGEGSFPVPALNGLSGTFTYYNGHGGEPAKDWTGWGTYGNPPHPSNGGTIIAYVEVRLAREAPFLGGAFSNSTITYSQLNPSKMYSIDIFDVTTTPLEVRLENVGSPSNGTLSFSSPLSNLTVYRLEVLIFELVQNL